MKAKKLSRQQLAVLREIECFEGADTYELNGICFRFGGRIHELRKLGCNIRSRRVKQGLYSYRLISAPRALLKQLEGR